MVATDNMIASCPQCGAQNRFAAERLADGPVCGQCKHKLLPHHSVAATDATFERQVLGSPVPVLVDFWAPWCAPCRAMERPLEEIVDARAPAFKVVKLNVDENPRTASRFGIHSIPHLMLFSGGQRTKEFVGALPKQELERQLEQALRGS